MKIILLGAAGFIGTNLIAELSKDPNNEITIVDRDLRYFKPIINLNIPNLNIVESDLSMNTDYEKLVATQDLVYHLISTTVPSTSNRSISEELKANVILSANLLDACVTQKVKKIAFISSGGTVYGAGLNFPINEKDPTNPITSYGIQKLCIEKLLYLYNYMYGLDYRIIRLSNPYGPYQRPDGRLGVITNFTYKALKGEDIYVYGSGSIVRDYIYIDDAIRGIQNIVNGTSPYKTFNLGCGYGTTIKEIIQAIESVLNVKLNINYTTARKVDVPVNYLDISRYEAAYGTLSPINLEEGIKKTAKFLKQFYGI